MRGTRDVKGRRADRRRVKENLLRMNERDEGQDSDAYGWAADVAGVVKLKGRRLLLPNRAGQKIRGPLRLS